MSDKITIGYTFQAAQRACRLLLKEGIPFQAEPDVPKDRIQTAQGAVNVTVESKYLQILERIPWIKAQ